MRHEKSQKHLSGTLISSEIFLGVWEVKCFNEKVIKNIFILKQISCKEECKTHTNFKD